MSATDHRRRAYLLAGIAVAGHTLPALAPHVPLLCGPLGIEDRTASGEGYALTFDDGPHAQGTPAVLEILAASRTPATFFLVGEQVRRDPALAREIVAAGHTVGLHCDRHRNLLRLARARGWRTLLWSDWGRDWGKRATPESIARRVSGEATAGAVLLLHDADDYGSPGSWRRMVAALPRVLDALAQRGLRPVAP